MSKNLYFLVSFVLVLALSGASQADPIDVNNYSFEYDSNGNQGVLCHMGIGISPNTGVLGWSEGPTVDNWGGVDVDCSVEEACEDCDDWHDLPDGNVVCYIYNDGTYVYQVLDFNIVQGHKYTLMWDGLAWGLDTNASFFYPEDPCVPDIDHIELFSKSYVLNSTQDVNGLWLFTRDLKIEFIATEATYAGEKLSIKFGGTPPWDDSYNWVDNVRVEWIWASGAYDPDPPDETEDVNSQALTLSWRSGLWAVNDVNGHEVYFGTSWAEVNSATTASDPNIYRGTGVGVVSGPDGNDRYSYVIPGGDLPFVLGQTYFWRIDEVNDSYVGPVPPVNDRWKGDVWSFMIEGRAKAVYPADGAENIPALNLLLRWEAGVGAGSHEVYFGTSKAGVEDANTNTAVIYRGWQPLSDVNYPVEDLEVGKSYFWRIDEVNTTTFVEGHVWSFTTGVFLIVDNFEWYQTNQDLRVVWKDYWSGSLFGLNGAEIKLMTVANDPNMVLSGDQSLEYAFRNRNAKGGAYVGSEARADAADLEVGSDWTVGGVKALVVNFYGDPCNLKHTYIDGGVHTDGIHQDQLWVAVNDVTGNEGVVQYPDMADIASASWHTWNISLIDPCFSGVNMANVANVYIGFGGQKIGQTKKGTGSPGDTVYFDDIRLYPPRCMPSTTGIDVLHLFGDIAGGEAEGDPDCNTNYLDLDIMARDWASTDGLANTGNRPAVLTGYPGATSHWITGFDGNNAIDANVGWNIDVDDTRLRGLESLSITAWVKQTIDNEWTGIVTSREEDTTGATVELGLYGAGFGGPGCLGYDWSNVSGDAWKHDFELHVPEDDTWTFVAVSVDPTGATGYMKTDAGVLQTGARNVVAHPPLMSLNEGFFIGKSYVDDGYHVGGLDDVRIYGYNLDFNDINNLAYETGEPNPPPVYWYKFDEVTGYSAADSGTPIEVYSTNMSPANLVPKDPCDSEDPNLGTGAVDPNNLDFVNFLDYRIMAEHWLEKHPWP